MGNSDENLQFALLLALYLRKKKVLCLKRELNGCYVVHHIVL